MFEEAVLAEQFEELLDREQEAVRLYAEWVSDAADPLLREEVEQLLREKKRHIELTERLLEIVG
jgi:hypothetical protein